MLRAGQAADHIAGVIQDGWHALVDMKRGSLVRAITRFRSDYLRANVDPLLTGDGITDKVEQAPSQLDVLNAMQQLYNIQKSRIERLAEFELTLPDGLRHKRLGDELRLADKILAHISHVQLQTGILRRAPKDIEAPPPA
jgi:hypothetical protein